MLPSPDRSLPRSAQRGPEPLRRKRVEAPAAVTPARRKVLNGLLAFATAVLLIDAFVGEKGLLEGLQARAAFREAQTKLDRLRAENRRLRERMRLLKDDRATQEALIREEMGYIRKGEVLFIVRDVPPAR